jgi:membrane-associated phospholipid phosphatase
VATLAIALSLWVVRHRQLVPALACIAAFGIGLLLEAGLKRWLFLPAGGTYPSGHALRAVLLVTLLTSLIPHRSAAIAAAILAAIICLSRIYVGEHYWYEVVGGALAGWALAMAATGLSSVTQRP